MCVPIQCFYGLKLPTGNDSTSRWQIITLHSAELLVFHFINLLNHYKKQENKKQKKNIIAKFRKKENYCFRTSK